MLLKFNNHKIIICLVVLTGALYGCSKSHGGSKEIISDNLVLHKYKIKKGTYVTEFVPRSNPNYVCVFISSIKKGGISCFELNNQSIIEKDQSRIKSSE